MERNAVSLETAKRLKAAGFPQSTCFYWWIDNSFNIDNEDLVDHKSDSEWVKDYSAPTAQEIADQLPALLSDDDDDDADTLLLVAKQESGSYWASYRRPAGEGVFADSMAEALAVLWLRIYT